MRKIIRQAMAASAGLAIFAGSASVVSATTGTFDPIALYGPGMEFDVLRDGDPVGKQTVAFSRDGDDLNVAVNFDVRVKMLGLTVYRFDYASTSLWTDGQLARLDANINDDGDELKVEAVVQDGATVVSGPKGRDSANNVLFPSNHWHPGVLNQDQIINTLTGSIADVTITRGLVEPVATASGTVQARKFSYSGDLKDVNVWYDDAGRWVRMTFRDEGGGLIEYRCVQCGTDSGSPS